MNKSSSFMKSSSMKAKQQKSNKAIQEQNFLSLLQKCRLIFDQFLIAKIIYDLDNQDEQKNKQQELEERKQIQRQRELLSIEPLDRDAEDVKEIMSYMRGDSGEQAFVILSGEIIIYVDEPTEYRGFMTLKEKARLQKGNIFGQLALKNNQKRTATARAGKRTDLIIIEKQVFNKYFADDIDEKPQITPHLRKLKNFLEGIDMFALIPSHIIDNLTTKCDIKKFPSNTIILKQGNDSAALYFVKQGKLNAVRLMPFRIHPETKQKIWGDSTDPSPYEMQSGLFVNEFIEIDELSDQDIFGDYSLLHQTEMDHSVITTVPTELVYINTFYVNQIIPEENLQVYKKSLKKYPNNVELKQLYWEKRNWESYRKSLMDNIILQKRNKSTFQTQLRLPVLRQNYKQPPLNSIDIKTDDCNLYFSVLNKENEDRNVKAKKKIKLELHKLRYDNQSTTGQQLEQQLERFQKNMYIYTSKNYRGDQVLENRSSLPSLTFNKSMLSQYQPAQIQEIQNNSTVI